MFLAGAAFAGVVLLLEGVLRVGGFGHDAHFFVPDADPGIFRTNPRFAETFYPPSLDLKPLNFRLPRQKPTGAIRIFVLGSSAALGLPAPAFGLAPQLRTQLRGVYPGKKFEVYGLGMPAIDSDVLRLIADEAAEFQPDVLVVYAGNNEVIGPTRSGALAATPFAAFLCARGCSWLRQSRVMQLVQRIAMRFHRRAVVPAERVTIPPARPLAPNDPRLDAAYHAFAENLTAIAAIARHAGAKLVLSTVAVNLADCAPFASTHRADLSRDELATWRQRTDQADEAELLNRRPQAESLLEQALRIDASYAETHFRLARVLAAEGNVAKARAEYALALQNDSLHLRADDAINAIIRRVARTTPGAITFADAAERLGATTTATAPISNPALFLDHVDLTWRGNYALGRAIAPAVAAALFAQPPEENRWLDEESCAARLGFTDLGRMQLLRQTEVVTSRPPFTAQYTYAEDRGRLAEGIAETAKRLQSPDGMRTAVLTLETALAGDPKDPALIAQLAEADAGANRLNDAQSLYDRLDAVQPVSADTLTDRALLLISAGQAQDAEKKLLQAVRLDPHEYRAYSLLAQLWAAGQQFGRARTFFADLVSKMPDSVADDLAYAEVLAAGGEYTAAVVQWRAVLEQVPDNETALDPVVRRLMTRNEPDAALKLMLRAYALNPRDSANDQRLVGYFGARGDTAKAAEYMRALVESGPVPPAMHADLGDLLLKLGRRHGALLEYVKARHAAEAAGNADVQKRAADAIRENTLSTGAE